MEDVTTTSTDQTTAPVESTPPASADSGSKLGSLSEQRSAAKSSGAQVSTHQASAVSADGTPAPSYSPNYKFVAANKEMEFDDFIKPIIKDADTEKKLKELYEKAYGLDEVKRVRDVIREEYKGYKAQWEPVVNSVQKAYKAFAAGDLDLTFKELGIPEKTIQQFVLKKLQMEELPEEQKNLYNQQQELKRQNMTMQEQLESYQQQMQNTLAQQRTQELNQAFSEPTAKAFQEAFDARNGEGAFRNEVINLGLYKWQSQKIDATPQQVIAELIQKYGFTAPQAAAPLAPQAAAPTPVTAAKDLPTIPVVKGGSASASHKKITSLKDVREAAKAIGV